MPTYAYITGTLLGRNIIGGRDMHLKHTMLGDDGVLYVIARPYPMPQSHMRPGARIQVAIAEAYWHEVYGAVQLRCVPKVGQVLPPDVAEVSPDALLQVGAADPDVAELAGLAWALYHGGHFQMPMLVPFTSFDDVELPHTFRGNLLHLTTAGTGKYRAWVLDEHGRCVTLSGTRSGVLERARVGDIVEVTARAFKDRTRPDRVSLARFLVHSTRCPSQEDPPSLLSACAVLGAITERGNAETRLAVLPLFLRVLRLRERVFQITSSTDYVAIEQPMPPRQMGVPDPAQLVRERAAVRGGAGHAR